MTSVAAEHPFEALRAFLAGHDVSAPQGAPPPISRLFRALGDKSASPLDLAVLFRHALRSEGGALRVPSVAGMPSAEHWAAVGVAATRFGEAFSVEGLPWSPAWLPDVPSDGVAGTATRAIRRRHDDPATADPFLATFGYESYRSLGQRRALRAALSAPRGSTLVVSLPTGEGKSLVFQALARIGLGDGPGVTLVVTPTVALAADHEQSSRQRGFDDAELAYRGGESERNQPLLDRLRSGQQSLCFASPEAVCGALSEPLREAARRGRLRAIVVDEAHLIDSWGINFRPEFQMLAGLRQELLSLASERRFRTVLLSATLTDDSIEVLRTLFPGEPFRIVSAARLRPEIEFWVADTMDQETRASSVIEAVLHLPRPLILYTTTRSDAAHWYEALRSCGLRRMGTVTGETPDAVRDRVVRGWRAGDIDVVVGTSAFGLGIDNPHVRSVVHACVPESLDRFYQETGRGGRDGGASISLVIPSHRDLDIARKLSRREMLTEEVAAHRWEAMFTHSDHRFEDGAHIVPVDCRPGVGDDEIDMVGRLNTSWNLKTLILMAAAGGISLLDVPQWLVRQVNRGSDRENDDVEESGDVGERPRVRLRINDSTHRDPSFWKGRIANFRRRQKASAGRSLDQMRTFLSASQCAAEIVAPLYEVAHDPSRDMPEIKVGRACGGCPSCRRSNHPVHEGAAPATPHPWPPVTLSESLQALLGLNGQLLVFHGKRASGGLTRRRERAALRRLPEHGVRNLVLLGNDFEADDFGDVANSRIFTAGGLGLGDDLPDGPTLITAGRDARLRQYHFGARDLGRERIWLLDESTPHPSKPGVTLRQAPPECRVLSLEELISELET